MECRREHVASTDQLHGRKAESDESAELELCVVRYFAGFERGTGAASGAAKALL